MNNLSSINFEKINDIVYANEENVVKELLEYLTPEYNSRLNNIKVRAGEMVTSARKSIWRAGLYGTGPKAGVPNYLLKFVNEKHIPMMLRLQVEMPHYLCCQIINNFYA